MTTSTFAMTFEEFEVDLQPVQLPAQFVAKIARAQSQDEVLTTFAHCIQDVLPWRRVSVALKADGNYLTLVSVVGNQAIPVDVTLPLDCTLVGRAFSTSTLLCCNDTSLSADHDCVMLHEAGLSSCIDVPIVFGGEALGTINFARHATPFSRQDAVTLFSIATILGLKLGTL